MRSRRFGSSTSHETVRPSSRYRHWPGAGASVHEEAFDRRRRHRGRSARLHRGAGADPARDFRRGDRRRAGSRPSGLVLERLAAAKRAATWIRRIVDRGSRSCLRPSGSSRRLFTCRFPAVSGCPRRMRRSCARPWPPERHTFSPVTFATLAICWVSASEESRFRRRAIFSVRCADGQGGRPRGPPLRTWARRIGRARPRLTVESTVD